MVNPYLYQVILSLSPVSENRGALLLGFLLKEPSLLNFLLSTIPIVLLAPILLLFWEKSSIAPWIRRILEIRTKTKREKVRRAIEKYGYLALLVFVAIPSPGTGVYTGSFIAKALGLEDKKALPYLILGAVFSSLIVLALRLLFGITLETKLL